MAEPAEVQRDVAIINKNVHMKKSVIILRNHMGQKYSLIIANMLTFNQPKLKNEKVSL